MVKDDEIYAKDGIPQELWGFCMLHQGKPFILYKGLLYWFHKNAMDNDGIQQLPEYFRPPSKENGNQAISFARVVYKGNTYIEIGDADPTNVNKMIAPHLIRMSATRAAARALRLALGIGVTALEELSEAEQEKVAEVPHARELAQVKANAEKVLDAMDAEPNGTLLRAGIRSMQADLEKAGKPFRLNVDTVPDVALKNAFDSVEHAWKKL